MIGGRSDLRGESAGRGMVFSPSGTQVVFPKAFILVQ
jgi:hypothetical protein